MSQKDINSTINALFDDFTRADGDINKMKCETENDVVITEVKEKFNYADQSLKLDFTDSFTGSLINN